jgi:hypothetical protein
MEHDSIHERGRALEEEYFRKKNAELIEKMRAAAAQEQARADISARTGVTDPALLAQFESLGFTAETVALLPLVPLLQVAWAEGGVDQAERALIEKAARGRGIEPGSAADAQLKKWLDQRPSGELFQNAASLVAAMLETPASGLSAGDLVKAAESIAAASGGFLGIHKVSAEEKQVLADLSAALTKRG